MNDQETIKPIIFASLDVTRGCSIIRVLESVSKYLNISKDDIRSPKRDKEIAFARHIFCYLAREKLYNHSLKSIGKEINKDHASVLHGCKKITNQLDLYRDVSETVENIKALLSYYTVDKFDNTELSTGHIGYYYQANRKRALQIWSEANDVVTKQKQL